jgi:hypothetical protein
MREVYEEVLDLSDDEEDYFDEFGREDEFDRDDDRRAYVETSPKSRAMSKTPKPKRRTKSKTPKPKSESKTSNPRISLDPLSRMLSNKLLKVSTFTTTSENESLGFLFSAPRDGQSNVVVGVTTAHGHFPSVLKITAKGQTVDIPQDKYYLDEEYDLLFFNGAFSSEIGMRVFNLMAKPLIDGAKVYVPAFDSEGCTSVSHGSVIGDRHNASTESGMSGAPVCFASGCVAGIHAEGMHGSTHPNKFILSEVVLTRVRSAEIGDLFGLAPLGGPST